MPPDTPKGSSDEAPQGFDAETFLKSLTRRPGVYQMLGADGEVLYVGKARNLKNRVTSYFRASGLTAKTMALVARIHDVRITITGSETEALLLEQSLIKRERPPYNIVLRDDKSYPYIHLTDHSDFPRLAFHRGAKRKQGRYFGPFPSAGAVRQSLNTLQKLFRIRQCDDTFMKNRTRPCLQHQIGRCSGPCVDLVSPEDYQSDVRHAVMFLEGRSGAVLEELKADMEAASAQLAFERAARHRDQIRAMRRVQEQQSVHAAEGSQDVDVVVAVREPGGLCTAVLMIRGGRMLGSRSWFPRDQLDADTPEVLATFIGQFYLGGGMGSQDLPQDIITNGEVEDADLLAAALTDAAGRKMVLSPRVRGQRARWLELALTNATQALERHVADRQNVRTRFEALQDALHLPEMPGRLECFDISHSSGEATVASCVVFDQDGPRSSDYRRFNIDNITPGDDYAAMEQALRRRYTRLKKGEGELPDVLVIDGGRGQVQQAVDVLRDLQVTEVLVLGVAKGPTRKAGLESIITPGGREIALRAHGGAMHLLQHIRDEAHRFAITGHRQRRGKARRASSLEGIDGVGPKRRRELLKQFGDLRGVKGASTAELAKVPGISTQLAQTIYDALHSD